MKKTGGFNLNKFIRSFGLWIFVAVLAGFSAGAAVSSRSVAQAATSYDDLRIFAEVLTLIQNYYVEEKTTKDLADGAIRGLLRTLDPHSSFMDVEDYKSRKQETEGKFGGLGIEITVMDSYIGIVAPIEDTPAEKAGLEAGDIILKIEGVTTKNMYLMDAVKKMRGNVGTPITLTIFRESANDTFDIKIVRDVIKIKSAKYAMIDSDTGYLRILTFSQNTATEANDAIKKMEAKGMKRLVLDLRNNPGGLLKQAIDVSDLFLEKGNVIVSTKGRTPDQNSVFMSNSWGGHTDLPLVVLVNAGSASASEIVAGAMKDLKRGVIVGQRTFGKGSVQTIRQLSDGSGLSLTTARYFTPADIMIHGIGIEPDISEKLIVKDEDGKDIELPEPLREKDLIDSFRGEVDRRHLNNNSDAEDEDGGKKKDSKDAKKAIKKKIRDRNKVFNLEEDNQLRKAVSVVKKLSGGKVKNIPKAG
ncbi:MAG: S41 family peptidase [Nitrospinota bacterium]|nr:S41 family peptidase [Nitrospinota bacterium]